MAKLDRAGFAETPIVPGGMIELLGMGVQDRRSAVIAADADRRMVIGSVAVPVEIDRITGENIPVIGIHERAVLFEVSDLLHDIDPRHTVFIPD